MAYILAETVQAEADKWTTLVALAFKRDFNPVAFEHVAGCACVKNGGTYYRFDFPDGSVLELYWNESDKTWDTGLTWIQPWATADIRKKRDVQT